MAFKVVGRRLCAPLMPGFEGRKALCQRMPEDARSLGTGFVIQLPP
jgi:hypothetical protein